MPTCVSFSTGHGLPTKLFLELFHPLTDASLSRVAFESALRFDLTVRAGILAGCPSTTPVGLVLGPALPWADFPSPGTLRLSATEILTPFIVTQSCIFTCCRSTNPSGMASTLTATLSYRACALADSAQTLFPIIIGAKVLDQ